MEKRITVFPGNETRDLFTFNSRKRRAVSPPAAKSPPLFLADSPPVSPVPPPKRRETNHPSLGPLLPVKSKGSTERPHFVYDKEHDTSSFDAVSQESPWKRYRPVLTEDQAGPITLAHKVESSFTIVAIRERKGAYRKGVITRCSHKNLVALQEVFFHDDVDAFYFVYEPMAVSLAALHCVPGDKLLAYEIAAISKEVRSDMLLLSTFTK